MFVVAVIDLRNTAVKANLGPFMIGLAVFAIGMSYGANAGYAINPARDFGPRLFAYFAGWGQVALPGTVDGASRVLLDTDRRSVDRRRDRSPGVRRVHR